MQNPDYIAGVGLAVMTVSILFMTFVVGIARGIDTLASQAYGAKNYYLVGWFLNRARVIVTIFFFIQAIVIFNGETILNLVGQPEASSTFASQYLIILLPGLWCMSQFELTRSFLTTQGVYSIIVIIQLITITVFDAFQSPCEFGGISVFEKIFKKKFYVKNYAFELIVN